jgi:hypothetical protein|tara:strand:- start:5611 stop:5910 length:300 start_codon:yes stop_codon:yes gene_type:complete
MPMDFPDMASLTSRATQRDFRQPHEGETEVQFRAAFADFMKPIDLVESMEIRTSRGWDNMNEVQTTEMLAQQVGGYGELFKLHIAAEKMVDKVIEEEND